MITSGLEKLIWQGKALFKNYSYAFGQTGCIPIPENKLCVITGINYFAALLRNSVDSNVEYASNVQLLRIESDKTVNDYIIRSKHHYNEGSQEIETDGLFHFDAYIVALNNLQIRIAVIPRNTRANIAAALGNAPGEANEPANPLGYASENVILNVGNPALFTYNPLAERNTTTPGDRNQFNINFLFDTLPNFDDSQARFKDSGYPIINFELVYIERAYMADLLSSK